jgi:hypothetical protein
VQTTERYLGCKQNLGDPVNDLFDLGTDADTVLRQTGNYAHGRRWPEVLVLYLKHPTSEDRSFRWL